MFGLGPATRIYLAVGATDMRKGFEGLYGLVRDRLGLEVQTGHLFMFANVVIGSKFYIGTAADYGCARNDLKKDDLAGLWRVTSRVE